MTNKRVKPNFKITRNSAARNSQGTLINYYEILAMSDTIGVSLGISGIDNPDVLANDICGAINKYLNFDFEVEEHDETAH